jgi:hypothetical protein
MKEATFKDAMLIADALNLDTEAVWQLIKGKRYSERVELEVFVCNIISQFSPEGMDIL